MDYKTKLRIWNGSEKYKREMLFLNSLLTEYKSQVLDYGCGRGMCAYIIGADGYDVNNYNDCLNQNEYFNELPDKDYSDIYFMHSFAHIPNPKDVLRILRSKYPKAVITVITPNLDWLDKDYVGDETVVKHYTQKELKEIFESCGYSVTLQGQFGQYKNGQNERIFLQCINNII